MTGPRILDLFCGAGLVADGLKAAGFDVVGVDIEPQPRYEGAFLQHDALTLDMRFIRSFDAIWASPPCLEATVLRTSARREQRAHLVAETNHRDLIAPTRALLQASGLPYVIENVEAAPLIDPVILCGSMFGLGATVGETRYQLRRHRKFEANWAIPTLECAHCGPVIGVYGGHARCRAAKAGGRGTADFVGVADKTALMREAMGVERQLTGAEVSQGIPPAYARWIGSYLGWRVRYGDYGMLGKAAA